MPTTTRIVHRPLALLLLALVGLTACPKRAAPPPPPPDPRSIRLLDRMHEQESAEFKDRREDIEVDTRSGERQPLVVSTLTTELLRLRGERGRLFGDEEASEGWYVDNFVLLEFLDEKDAVLHRVVVGYAEAVLHQDQQLDTAGPQAFKFEPGQVDLTSHFPDRPFKIRATALDTGSVGKVSDLWLRLEPRASAEEDDWR